MRRLIVLAVVICLFLKTGEMPASAASKEGALAYDYPTGAYGFAYNYPSTTQAEKKALSECSSGSCSVVVNFDAGMCASFYKGDNAYGWGTGSTINNARSRAERECNARGSGCYERVWGCNSK
jgi:hypothetical protein